jgi:perosamine synthetase
MIKNIPFSRPCFNDRDLEEIASKILAVLRSGWLTSGQLVNRFEEQFADFVGAEYAVALNSCTAALHSILLALGIAQGDEVIVPTNTFVATANAVLYTGAQPVFADSDPETFNIDPGDIERKISKKTKAVIVVHLCGNPCDMNAILKIAEENDLIVIEDCAHSLGAKYKGRNCGTFGIAAAFSFYPTKIITTGEGGMVVTNDHELADKIKVIRNHGRASYGPAKITDLGFNYRMTEINAVIGISQLAYIYEYIDNRNRIAKQYNEKIAKIEWLTPQKVREENLSSYYAYNVKVEESAPVTRDELIIKLKEKGIETSILYVPIHLQPYYTGRFGFKRGSYPIAELLGKTTIALPIYNCMSMDDAIYVMDTLEQIYEETWS